MNRHRCGWNPDTSRYIGTSREQAGGTEQARTYPDNKFTPIYRGDRNRGAKVSRLCLHCVSY